ncbi:CLUMA_CG002259, isoform A [Clunio marinus]|uniref:CLUMA_CG002259, isoform A n=1 Tax=Clunio marinus TaxID=568069 RepID=A0A1J1HPR0_9DIPT|nr:CLUMA_CG002259, isoform A [Clunio marinus]
MSRCLLGRYFHLLIPITSIIAGIISLASGQTNQRYSLQNMPHTSFTCRDKILGGYYADAETNCQMFHICVKVAGVGIQDFRFLCPNGTAFDQEAQICADWGDVDCEAATLYYGSDNFDLYRIGSNFESKKSSYAEEDESVFHLQRAETSDARRSKQYIVNQNKQNTVPTTRPTTTIRQLPPSTTTTTTTPRPSYEPTTSRIVVSTYRPTSQPRNQFQDNVVSTYRPTNNFFSNHRSVANNNDDEILKQSQSANFFNNKNNGKEDFYEDTIKTTKAPAKQKVRSRQRGRSKYRNVSNVNSVTSAPSRNHVTAAATQRSVTEQQSRQTFTNTPIVVQSVSNSRSDFSHSRFNQTSNNYRTSAFTASPTTNSPIQTPKHDETFFDVPKINQKQQTTKLKSSPAQNLDFKTPTSTASPHVPIDEFPQNLFGAIPQRVIIPSKLSPEQRKALQASNGNNNNNYYNNLQTTSTAFTTPTSTPYPQSISQVNRNPNHNQLRQNNEQKDFSSLPQKFNFKTQKYESIEPQNPTTQFYNPKYETKGTEQPFNSNINLEPTRSGFTNQSHKTFAPRQSTTTFTEESKPTTFNPQQYYQSEQSQYQNLSPRGFSLAAQKQQEQTKKTTQSVLRPHITSRSEARNHKKFSTLVPKDQYYPTTFKPNNNFNKKPIDYVASQKLEKIQNPNKYYSQFTSTPAPTTHSYVITTTQPQLNTFVSHHQQHNNFQPETTRISNFFSTSSSVRPLAEGEEDDGQYRPELYEKDFYRNKVRTTKVTTTPVRNNFNNFYQTSTTFKPQDHNSNEDEFLKTAHSQNIFASGNKLRAEKEREKNFEKFDFGTEKSSPRPFSKPTPVTSTTPKPKQRKEEKDVSYDYQYYDTNGDQNDYTELEAIADFGKTSKKSSVN